LSYSVDVNILVNASNSAGPHFERARAFLRERVHDRDLFCLAWSTLLGYVRIVTHPSIFSVPLTPAEAVRNVDELLSLPRVRLLSEGEGYWKDYLSTVDGRPIRGNLVPDAALAALLRHHGVSVLYTADADFRRFVFLDVRNPFEER
jgi:toxin-antitoxin system PIN domain toxin